MEEVPAEGASDADESIAIRSAALFTVEAVTKDAMDAIDMSLPCDDRVVSLSGSS